MKSAGLEVPCHCLLGEEFRQEKILLDLRLIWKRRKVLCIVEWRSGGNGRCDGGRDCCRGSRG